MSNRITTNPEILHGKPSIRGLRYSVDLILELLDSGMTNTEILADYEDLEQADLDAVSALSSKDIAIQQAETDGAPPRD